MQQNVSVRRGKKKKKNESNDDDDETIMVIQMVQEKKKILLRRISEENVFGKDFKMIWAFALCVTLSFDQTDGQ